MTVTAVFVRVASVDEVPAGTGKAVTVDGQQVALFNVNGTFYAIDDTCTHEEASLAAGAGYGEIVAGPEHGARFHRPPGRGLSLPAGVPGSTYQVKMGGRQVLLLPGPPPAPRSPRSSAPGGPRSWCSPGARPRPSTWWPTPGAAPPSGPATRSSSPRWSTTATSCPGSSWRRRRGRS